MIPAQETIAWLAAPAGIMLVAAAIAAAFMRSVFAAAIFALVASVAAGTAALALGAPSIALALVLVGGFAFIMFAGTILLTARAARARPLLGLAPGAALAVLIAGALIWAAPDVGRDASARARNQAPASVSRNEARKEGSSSTNPPAQGRFQAEWKPVGRPESALNQRSSARSDAKPLHTFAERAQGEVMLLGALGLAGGLSVYGLLGFGERAAFAQRRDRRR